VDTEDEDCMEEGCINLGINCILATNLKDNTNCGAKCQKLKL
jgi:hypothetical protein